MINDPSGGLVFSFSLFFSRSVMPHHPPSFSPPFDAHIVFFFFFPSFTLEVHPPQILVASTKSVLD